MWGALSDEKSGLYFSVFLGIVSAAFLKSESHRPHEHILLSLILCLPQPGRPGSCIYFPQEKGSPVIPPGIGLLCPKFEVTLRLTISQSVVLVSSTLVGLATRYYFLSECCCLKFAVLFLWGALSD
jgi:hypothetical protein